MDFINAVIVTGSTELIGDNITMLDTVTGDAAGTLTATAGTDLTIDGLTSNFASTTLGATAVATIFDVTGSGDISITGATITLDGSDYTSTAGSVDFVGAVGLVDDSVSITSGGAAGNNITFSSSINGDDLTLDSGAAGTIAVTGITTVDNLVITNSGGAIFTGAVDATTDITITDTTDGTTVSFLDAVTANDLVTTAGNGYEVSMTGTGNEFTQEVDFVNTGTVTLGDATADTFTFNMASASMVVLQVMLLRQLQQLVMRTLATVASHSQMRLL